MPAHFPRRCRASIGASASLVAAAVLVACEAAIADRPNAELVLDHAEKSSAAA